MFRHRAAVRREAVALREKALGVWRSVSWRDFEERARLAGLGLAALGLEPGDRVCVLSRNNPEWLYVDLGTLGIGGVCAGIYPTDAPQQVAYIVNHCAAKFLFVEDDEQLDKALAVRADMPCLSKIVVFDMRHLHDFADEAVIGMDALFELGRSAERRDADLWQARTAAVAADDLAILVYTSGTTGPPKGAMLSHRNIVQQCEGLRTLLPVSSDDERLSFLPLCHAAERILAYACIREGVTTNFAESMDTVPENLRELQPTVMMAVPRVWERFHSQITGRRRRGRPGRRLRRSGHPERHRLVGPRQRRQHLVFMEPDVGNNGHALQCHGRIPVLHRPDGPRHSDIRAERDRRFAVVHRYRKRDRRRPGQPYAGRRRRGRPGRRLRRSGHPERHRLVGPRQRRQHLVFMEPDVGNNGHALQCHGRIPVLHRPDGPRHSAYSS